MNKFNTIFEAPILNRSGYGVTCDLLAHSLMRYQYANLAILPLTWGGCPSRIIEQPGDQNIKQRIPPAAIQIPQPQLHISCYMPHHVKPKGSIYNIMISAGVEVDRAPDALMNGVNQWDLNIVCSNFTKQVYLNSKIKPKKPVEVLNWSANTDIFKLNAPADAQINQTLDSIPEEEVFLFCGQTTNGDLAKDRKDAYGLVKTFLETFTGRTKKPALLLKTNGINTSVLDRNQTIDRFKAIQDELNIHDVNLYVLHGDLSETQMASLYCHKKVIALVSFTHGEGAGLPLLEASLCGLPIIVSNYSGLLDYVDNRAILLPGNVAPIGKALESEYFEPGSCWFNVDYHLASQIMQQFYDQDRSIHKANAISLAKDNSHRFSYAAFDKKLHNILNHYLGIK